MTLYTVRPRYTAGSPAGVDRQTAELVARQEAEAIEFVLDGYLGEEAKAEAERLGLQRIVYSLQERGNHFTCLFDVCTEERVQGWREVEAELACIGTRGLPRHAQIPDWIMPAFEASDLIDRRRLVQLAVRHDLPGLTRLGQEMILGFAVERATPS